MTCSRNADTVRGRLKSETISVHQEVEGALEKLSCFETPQGFAVYLRAMRDCHQRFSATEPHVAKRCGFQPSSVEVVNAIVRDLKRLEEGTHEAEAEVQLSASADEAWGIQYALQGSAMGARMLKPRSVAFFADGKPSEYLSILVDLGSERWSRFVKELGLANPNPALAIAGARTVFETVLSNLNRQN
ncbi:hypothetical protein [Pelagicoccus sp. SDUM812002]|uniref:hypothetical protein n=1 Tax=Pelagicoccus sp. SDUM812002 TaxID=3041266 RepID=UPI00280D08A3|nr:hypothetical protein [Pelagicoccus sp. SDUM812002]MDQ8184454.1 hypothetical protein [Pelagicoccus sp. SDUM812002]